MILIGSTRLKELCPDFPREPKDIDYIVEDRTFYKSSKDIEYLDNPGFDLSKPLDLNDLYTLKLSHMFWDINWEKHLFDIRWLQDHTDAKVDKDLFYKLYQFWTDYHGENKRSELALSADEFFNNAVDTEHDHDWVHTLIKNPPTFTKILIGEVEVSEEKFNQLSHTDKLSLAREEVYVMAWERMQHMHYRQAYGKMLKKFIMNHAPLWEAIFILDNYNELAKPEYNFIEHINNQIEIHKQC